MEGVSRMHKISVCEPMLDGNELKYLTDCVKTNWISSRGKYVDKFEQDFSAYCGVKYGASTTNGTTALHLALVAIGITKNDEVILPTFTMAATAFAVLYTRATPIFVDSEPNTWNIDPSKIHEKITKNTKAIMVMHTYGHPCYMMPIKKIANEYDLKIIEDAAEAHGSEYKGRKCGALGDVACFSFYANKNITTGEGGMLISNDEEIIEKAKMLKDMAFVKKRRFYHPEIGFNYRMTNLQAAIGCAQLEKIEQLIEIRRKNAELYNTQLKNIDGVTTPPEEKWAKNTYWMYSILVDEDKYGMNRNDLMNELREKGIETRPFFYPIHLQPFINQTSHQYPVAERLSETGLNLPSGPTLKKNEINYITGAIEDEKN